MRVHLILCSFRCLRGRAVRQAGGFRVWLDILPDYPMDFLAREVIKEVIL